MNDLLGSVVLADGVKKVGRNLSLSAFALLETTGVPTVTTTVSLKGQFKSEVEQQKIGLGVSDLVAILEWESFGTKETTGIVGIVSIFSVGFTFTLPYRNKQGATVVYDDCSGLTAVFEDLGGQNTTYEDVDGLTTTFEDLWGQSTTYRKKKGDII